MNPRDPPARPIPDPVIVALFALRLAKRLIEGLRYYPDRDLDVRWIEDFLAPYSPQYAMAAITGRRRENYMNTYPRIIARMKSQPRYPARFMQLHPDRPMLQDNRGAGQENASALTDYQRLIMIDFCDAACEWGSVVPIPARDAQRMIELANQRSIAQVEIGLYAEEIATAYEYSRR